VPEGVDVPAGAGVDPGESVPGAVLPEDVDVVG